MKVVATKKSEQNRALIDPWTLVHFGVGLATGLARIPLRWSVMGAIAYEVLEQYAERRDWGNELFETQGPETRENLAMDVAAFILGAKAGEAWNRTENPRQESDAADRS